MWFTSLKKNFKLRVFVCLWIYVHLGAVLEEARRGWCVVGFLCPAPPSDFNPMHVQLNGGIRWQIRISSLRVSSFCRHPLCLPLGWQAVLYEWGHSQKGRMNSTPPLHLSLRWGRQQSAAESALASPWHHYARDGGLQLGVAFVSRLPSSPRARSHSLRPGGRADTPTVLTLWLLRVACHLTFHNPMDLKWRSIDLYTTRVKNLGFPVR